MMKRFNVDWKTLQQDLETHDWDEVEFMLKKKKLGSVIPREEDLHGAAQALIRLQDVYELDIRDLSKGLFLEILFLTSSIYTSSNNYCLTVACVYILEYCHVCHLFTLGQKSIFYPKIHMLKIPIFFLNSHF